MSEILNLLLSEENMFSEQFKFNSILLNAELHSAGAFLYDACVEILQLEKDFFNYEQKLFNIFYKISVGIERFQKIIEVLNINPTSEEELKQKGDKLLLKHSHQGLGDKLEKNNNLLVSSGEKRLLQYLQIFYNEKRYGYYSFNNTNEMTYKLLLEYTKLENNNDVCYDSLNPALKILKENLSKLISLYVTDIEKISMTNHYFTTESESHTKWFALSHYKEDIFICLKLREIAIKDFINEFNLEDKEYSYCVEAAEHVEHINDIISGGTCSSLVDAITQGYEDNEIEINKMTSNQLEDLCSELDYKLNNRMDY